MSLFDYRKAVDLYYKDTPFYSLIMAAMLKADDKNTALLKGAWPEVWGELDARYNARGGILDEDNISEDS